MEPTENVRSERTITDYEDYREYLSARWNDLKSTRKFSFEQAARKLKTSKSYLNMVMAKKRHVTADKIIIISDILKLNQTEREYFYFIFLLTTTKEPQLRSYLKAVIKHYQINMKLWVKIGPSRPEHEQVFTEWPRLVLHSLARLRDFAWTPEWLNRRITGAADRDSLKESVMKDLLTNKILVKTPKGYKAEEFIMKSSKPMEKDMFRRAMGGFLRQALAYVESSEPHRHAPSGAILLPLSKERFEQAARLTVETQKELMKLSIEDPAPEELYFYVTYMVGLTQM